MSEAIPAAAPRLRWASWSHASAQVRIRRIGYAVLGLQFAGFAAWSWALYSRFALTFDFAIYHQAWYLIAHGDLNPYSTLTQRLFWQNHSEFIMWPLALLYWAWPHGVTLLWVQDACVVAAEAVAFGWACEIAQRHRPDGESRWLIALGLVLLVANPWIWWSVSFDFHAEPLALLPAVLLLRDLAAGRRRAWVWVIPLLACGDVACTYLAGAGLGGVLAGRRSRMPGAVMACLGAAAVAIITAIHGNLASGGGLAVYSYLAAAGTAPLGLGAIVKGIAAHPSVMLQTLWAKRLDILVTLSPSGLVGLGYAPLLPFMIVVLLANALFQGLLFTEPSFQNLPVYVLLPVGSIAVVASLMRRHRAVAFVLAGVLAAQAIGWAVVWLPKAPGEWIRVSASSAQALAQADNAIPARAQVIASQGIIGRLASRADVRAQIIPGQMAISSRDTWFLVAPSAGVESQSTASAMALLSELAGPLHATLVMHGHGIWAFRWRPPRGTRTLAIPGGLGPLPAWASPGAAGRDILAGPPADWHVAATGGQGYVTDGLEWLEPVGLYEATVDLSAAGPVNVEVWDDNGNVLLARRSIPATAGVQSVSLPVTVMNLHRPYSYSGWGPFRVDFVPPRPGERLEIRVWSPGHELVDVYRAKLVRASG
ncbi:MAG: DUF2079 domain-containing protein [Streptosporangiaceae bacterium]|jgi:hypothetical protein